MENLRGQNKKVWISRFGKAGLMTIILMLVNNSLWIAAARALIDQPDFHDDENIAENARYWVSAA